MLEHTPTHSPKMSAIDALRLRRSTQFFDPDHVVDDVLIELLVSLATEAPSSIHIQHWRFIAVKDAQEKEALCSIADGQPKVLHAAVTFIILGKIDAHRNIKKTYAALLQAGAMDEATFARQQKIAGIWYDQDPQARREEAIRSASLAAMNLMTAAVAFGFGSCPMIGFDHERLREAYQLDDSLVPVMLIAVGREGPGNYPKKPRLPVYDVLLNARGAFPVGKTAPI